MRTKILLVGLLSTTMSTYAQDSLSIPKPPTDIPDKQLSDNNIRNVSLHTSLRKSIHSSSDTVLYQAPPESFTPYSPISDWSTDWFINLSAGAGAFVGNPLGCEDLFGRTRPMYHLSVGKWFNPSAGGRVSFQGFDLKNHLIQRQDYYHLHADFLLNATNLFRQSPSQAFWQVIPFAGAGIIQNNATHRHPFTLNYGILNQFRLNNSFSLSLELGGLTTFADFDGAGKSNRFSDHLFHLSAGFTITLGQKTRTYSRSCTTPDIHSNTPSQPVGTNNYSGLNSLRERLSATASGETTSDDETDWFGHADTLSADPIKQLQSINTEYLKQLTNRKAPVGAPILFFFRIGTTTLTDASQLANLDAIATVCNKFNLITCVTGYADSATGNTDGNSVLSKNRANYITAELIKRGMEEKSITAKGEGGVATYSPAEVNRCVKVEIYLKQ